MRRVRSTFNVYGTETSIPIKAHGASITNRGSAVAVVEGVVSLAEGESFSLPIVDAETQYNQELSLRFDGSGSKKVIVQKINIIQAKDNC